MLQSAHHHDAFARTRMLRVLDQNVEGLFLGSMSPSRMILAYSVKCFVRSRETSGLRASREDASPMRRWVTNQIWSVSNFLQVLETWLLQGIFGNRPCPE
jgi:hypothetical protein